MSLMPRHMHPVPPALHGLFEVGDTGVEATADEVVKALVVGRD